MVDDVDDAVAFDLVCDEFDVVVVAAVPFADDSDELDDAPIGAAGHFESEGGSRSLALDSVERVSLPRLES